MPFTDPTSSKLLLEKLHATFCRKVELAEITSQLRRDDCSAIFVSSEMGMGATSLLRELATLASSKGAVIELHGTPSLAIIPFGILTPYLRRTSSSFVESHIDAIRKMLTLMEEQTIGSRARLGREAENDYSLVIIDNADYIDTATAEVVMSLVQAGRVKVVISHRVENEPVQPLPRLWAAGLAEKFRLRPLSRSEAHDFCNATLGGKATKNTSWYFWSTAGGNPLLMRLVVEDALSNGKLREIDGVWVMDMQAAPVGHQLQEVVREQLRGLTAEARQTLNLVALSEPIKAEIVSKQLGWNALGELSERHLIHEIPNGSGVLCLVNPIYGEVIREMVPRAQSRLLHSQLIREIERDTPTPESLLRMVIWSVESGHHVPDLMLLSAATFACKIYESGVAIRLASEVTGAENVGKAQVIRARANFNTGQYLEASNLLAFDEEKINSISELLFGALLRAETRSALGLSADAIHQDADNLRLHGERLAREEESHAADILVKSKERAEIIDLMAYSRVGRYAEMEAHIGKVLSNIETPEDMDHLCNRSMALAMDAERLSALGFPVTARNRAAEAFAINQAEDHNEFFVPEMIISRLQIALILAGEWDEAEQFLQSMAVDVGKVTMSFGGSVGVARGMMMLRQGRSATALEVLLEGLDALQHSDPQQLFGYCVSMAAYASVRIGKDEKARYLMGQYREDASMYLAVVHERAFIAATREHLDGDGSGLADLLRIADDASERGHLTAELNALSLALDFAPTRIMLRLRSVAVKVEGSWAAGLASYAGALERNEISVMVAVAQQLLEAQMYQYAGKLLQLASSVVHKDHKDPLFQQVHDGLNLVGHVLDPNGDAEQGCSTSRSRAQQLLTAREQQIALMAAQGMTDKLIASRLHVSVRTVEGHLYRCYAKLDIATRSELTTVLLN